MCFRKRAIYLATSKRRKKSVPVIQLLGNFFFFFEGVSFSNVNVYFLSVLAFEINPQRRKLERDTQPRGADFGTGTKIL